jgi:hypothetical protein
MEVGRRIHIKFESWEADHLRTQARALHLLEVQLLTP